jgi:hypothetical protein
MLSFRFKNVKEKMDDFSGELEELSIRKASRLNNISTIKHSIQSHELHNQDSNYVDIPLNQTFSRNDSINKLFINEHNKANLKHLILDKESNKINHRTIITEPMNFSNYCNFETHAETRHYEDMKNNYRGNSIQKPHLILMDEDKIITEKMRKIQILVLICINN